MLAQVFSARFVFCLRRMDSDDDIVIGWAAEAEAEAATTSSDDIVVPVPGVPAVCSQAVPQPSELTRTGRVGCWLIGAADVFDDPDERHLVGLAEMSWTVETPPGEWDATNPAYKDDGGARARSDAVWGHLRYDLHRA